jgi:hypothetical protein
MKVGIFLIIILSMLGISLIVQVIIAKKFKRDVSQDLYKLAVIRLLAKRIVRIKGQNKSKVKKLAYKVLSLTEEEKLSKIADGSKTWIKYYTGTTLEIEHFLDELLAVIQGPEVNGFKSRVELAWSMWMKYDGGDTLGKTEGGN